MTVDIVAALASLKSVLRSAWDATTLMDSFDMESDFKNDRYNENRRTLSNMCNQVGVSTYSPPSPYGSSGRSSSSSSPSKSSSSTGSTTSSKTTSSSSSSGNMGCILGIICLVVCGGIGCAIGGGVGVFIGALIALGIYGKIAD